MDRTGTGPFLRSSANPLNLGNNPNCEPRVEAASTRSAHTRLHKARGPWLPSHADCNTQSYCRCRCVGDYLNNVQCLRDRMTALYPKLLLLFLQTLNAQDHLCLTESGGSKPRCRVHLPGFSRAKAGCTPSLNLCLTVKSSCPLSAFINRSLWLV